MEREGREGKIKQILHCDLPCKTGNDLEITFWPYKHIPTSHKRPVKMARLLSFYVDLENAKKELVRRRSRLCIRKKSLF